MPLPAGVLGINSTSPVILRLLNNDTRDFECYIGSEPQELGYRKRLADLWKNRNTNEEPKHVTEEGLADQVRQIITNNWLQSVKQEGTTVRVRNIIKLEQIHQIMKQHLLLKRNTEVNTTYQLKRNSFYLQLKSHERSALNLILSVTGT